MTNWRENAVLSPSGYVTVLKSPSAACCIPMRTVIASGGTTGTSPGAAMLTGGSAARVPQGTAVAPPDARWALYARQWMEEAEARVTPRRGMKDLGCA